MKIYKISGLIILLLLALFLNNPRTFAVGVKPLVIDVDARPGDSKEFELELTPSKIEKKVKLSLYQLDQLIDGSLKYSQAEIEGLSAANWVDLEEGEVRVYPDQSNKVKGRINIPYDAAGSETVVIMVEPQSPVEKQGGIKFMVRYAVRINIRVDRAGLRREAELMDFTLEADQEGKPVIKTRLNNPSAWDYSVYGEAIVRDSQRRLVERVPLLSPVAIKNNSNEVRLYPGSEVKFLAPLTKYIAPGEYDLRIFLRYGEYGQIIQNEKVVIKEGDFNFAQMDKNNLFSIEQEDLELELKPGQRKSERININSQIGEDIEIRVSNKKIAENYANCMWDWLEIRGNKQFDLRGRGSRSIISTLQIPRKIEEGSYHSRLLLEAYSLEDNELIAKQEIPLTVIVGQKHNYEINIRTLHTQQLEEGLLLSLNLANKSKIFINPKAEIVIRDSDDNFIKRANLELPEGVQKILPEQEGIITALVEELETDSYQAEIILSEAGNEIKTIKKEFIVD